MGLYGDLVFPWLLDHLEGPELRRLRAETVAGASGEMLEIGFGTGGNLPFYGPGVTSVTAVEPASGMNRRARRRIASATTPVKLMPGAGEELPFPEASFDCVVMTITLCTVDDPARVLAGARRVLRPGGRYLFFEHVAAPEPRPRAWQERLNGVSRILGCGCNLNRDTESAIRSAGFGFERLDRFRSPAMPVPALYPLIAGVALKA
ncbi:MAG: class I SAM-dependent methyltransferase [Candidatus Binatia bacterium]